MITFTQINKNIARIAHRYRMEWMPHGKHGRRIWYWRRVKLNMRLKMDIRLYKELSKPYR